MGSRPGFLLIQSRMACPSLVDNYIFCLYLSSRTRAPEEVGPRSEDIP